MSGVERVEVGGRYMYDGEAFEIVELATAKGVVDVLGKSAAGQYMRVGLAELLSSVRVGSSRPALAFRALMQPSLQASSSVSCPRQSFRR